MSMCVCECVNVSSVCLCRLASYHRLLHLTSSTCFGINLHFVGFLKAPSSLTLCLYLRQTRPFICRWFFICRPSRLLQCDVCFFRKATMLSHLHFYHQTVNILNYNATPASTQASQLFQNQTSYWELIGLL